ncbi:MAG: spore germination protein [Clostridia bacterium]
MRKISKNLTENLNALQCDYLNAVDFTKVQIKVGGIDTLIVSLDGQIDKQYLSVGVIGKLVQVNEIPQNINIFDYVKNTVLAVAEHIELVNIEDINEKIMLGFAVVLFDGCDKGISFGVQGYQFRGVQEPDNESMLRGSKEGFVEAIMINMSLIRRRLRTTDLKFERMIIGSQSQTPALICYLENRVSKEILDKIKLALHAIDLKTVMAAGYLPGFLGKNGVFSGVGITERPDTVCGKIEEGRVAILIDGTPTAIVVPYLFAENFQCLDDYANKPVYASYIRILKYISFLIAVFLPAIYVAIIGTRPELMPDSILIKIAQEEIKTPFNVLWEIIFVNILYEIMREASLRAPKVLGQSVSIVGALVIGDMAVSSSLIGAPSLIVIALSAIAGYSVPKLYESLALLRFTLIFVAGILGTWGLIFACVFILYSLCSQSSFGLPITTPISPFNLKSMRDVLIRAPWKVLTNNRSKVQDMPGKEC